MQHVSRRSAIGLLGGTALAAPWVARAAGKSVTIGMDFSITGSDAESSIRARDGALMAIEDFNQNGGPGGYHLNTLVLEKRGLATATPAEANGVAAESAAPPAAPASRKRQAAPAPSES